ncbi:pentatricopeptide repeat-containing protein At3g56030, mitochondrial-like isoform X2 [Malania oleifera]|nr:pentatricopeptide repeat-containing protein At3g56030, mitochondrial-like isoform X2 [Malania oleifera]XP_057980136.1 pentatricopeptide repeat-containing protein At3g56030, mitochondrial-like isoform X2 [Malania oleifera]XP_057980137.1 pentatricopeptide repeat-containing protein At3g56030, mitochondrial-like isoform X2 [Malania oleifera]XP_057980139.1 pentatricopeptide repeat-containing protein At3g56030, mitochondrial-like isoform X2 [Malania oleifera]
MLVLRKLIHKLPNFCSFFSIGSRSLTSQDPNLRLNEPSSVYYDELIYAAGRSRDFATIHHLLNKRMKDGFFNTNNTFKFITNAASDSSSLLNKLSQTLARLDEGFPRKSAYDSLIMRLCKLDRMEESLRLVEEMIRGGYGANACSFHLILSALTRRKKMEAAWHVIELMRKIKISLDVTAYNYLLTAYSFAGNLSAAAGVLENMREEGMEADTRTYDALVLGACKAGKVEGAFAVLRRMEDYGVSQLYSTHAHVINALLRSGYYAQAVEFVMSYAGRDRHLDMESFGLLANRLIGSNRFEEATLVLEEMCKRGVPMEDKLKHFCNIHCYEVEK